MSNAQLRKIDSLVSTTELASLLDQVKVLDGTCQVQTEILVKTFEIRDKTTALPYMLPTPEVFAEAVGQLGITENNHVVIYDTVGILGATRVYWTFKVFGHRNVSILNGGLPKWLKDAHPTEIDASKVASVKYTLPTLNKQLVINYSEIIQHAQQQQQQRGDAKEPSFQLLEARPAPLLSAGKIPGSTHISVLEMIGDGQLLDLEKLRGIFESHGVDINKKIVTTCGAGIAASTVYFALEKIGAKDIAVYDGSFAEYASRTDSIIEKPNI
ncbi:Rhodanese-like domain-containing protein [Phascolomyces articulosus]|uniref:Rhodanese-like domain-containing protein n=1 Tax=Phascolomyces articulosus TaxID=60185 RepID=A0AAD5JX59_9FUNG|nr:Rhodanese-like domain-containing protein [Phascolomyces articulosus]